MFGETILVFNEFRGLPGVVPEFQLNVKKLTEKFGAHRLGRLGEEFLNNGPLALSPGLLKLITR